MRRIILLLATLAALDLAAWSRDLTTTAGAVFPDAIVTGVEPTGLDIRFRGGTAFLKFSDVPPNEMAAFFQLGKGDSDEAQAQPPVIVAPPEPEPEELAGPIEPPPDIQYVPEIDSLDGVVFDDCYVLSVDRRGLRFRHRDGIGFLPFSQLSEELRHRFDFQTLAHNSGRGRGHAGASAGVSTTAPARPGMAVPTTTVGARRSITGSSDRTQGTTFSNPAFGASSRSFSNAPAVSSHGGSVPSGSSFRGSNGGSFGGHASGMRR